MTRIDLQAPHVWGKVIAGSALGALAMYVLDPTSGRRRRALARDKVVRSVKGAGEITSAAARDARYRAQGLFARVPRLARHGEAVDDRVLIERVRARLGRACSHPHAIDIDANQGCVTVSGPVLASEAEPLLDAVRSTPGVTDVVDRLAEHNRADSISSLQGGVHRAEARSELMQENWTPSLRVAAVVGGSGLAAAGIRERGPLGVALAVLGVLLAARGATNMPMKRMAGLTGRRSIDIEKAIHIDATPDVVYDLWSDCTSFPRFMSHVEEVRMLGDGRTHWVVKGPAGMRIEWDAVTTSAERPHRLSWRTEAGATVQHAGSVFFEPSNGGTRVTVRMSYNAAGALGHALAALAGADPKRQLDDDLMRMKTYVEQGMPPHDAGARQTAASPQTVI